MFVQESHNEKQKSIWNYHPPVPIKNSPVFAMPWSPVKALTWLTKRWVTITHMFLFLVLAVSVYHFFPMNVTEMSSLSITWIGTILLRNLILFVLFAGTLHLYLYTFSKQGQLFKFDLREQMKNNPSFTFHNQVFDNMFWSLTGGVLTWTFFETMYFWGVANGVIPTFTFAGNEIWFLLWLVLFPIFTSSHFYWVHRFLHWPPIYKRIHALHHKNVNIGPWSGMSMHPVESFLYLSAVLIHFVVPTHPIIFLLHMYLKAIGPVFSHAGYEKVVYKENKLIHAGDFHHQLHHRYFECNYGTAEAPWDKWFHSFHDGTAEATIATNERRRKKYSRM